MFKTRKVCTAVYAALALGNLSGICAAETTLEKARASGYVTMGFTNEVPYSYSEDGKLTGADTVVVDAVMKKIQIKEVVGVLTEFQALIPGLVAKRFDLNSTMYIRPSRCKQVIFTQPLWSVGDAVIVKKGNPSNIRSYTNIASNPEVKVGYLAGGTVIADHLRAAGVKEGQLVPFPDPASAFAGVKSGRIAGFASTAVANQTLLDRSGDSALERATPFEQPMVDGKPILGFGALSFRQDDKDFYETFNAALKAFVGTPEHLALVRPFGITAEDIALAKAASVTQLCAE